MGKTNNAKAVILKLLMPLCTKLSSFSIKALTTRKGKNRVGPIISADNTKTDFFLLDDIGGLNLDRRDDEYLQARRAMLNSYRLSDGRSFKEKMTDGRSFKQRMTRALKEVCREIGRTRVGVKVYRVTMSCPWNISDVPVFKCFLPHFKCIC